MKVVVVGTGFVGVVSAAVYASFGNEVVGVDIDPAKVESLKKGHVPFYEPGLEQLLQQQQSKGNLRFTTEYEAAVTGAEVIFVAVGTPSQPNGEADLQYVRAACTSLAPYLQENAVVVIKSTVPPGTLDALSPILDAGAKVPYIIASVPEFLREGSAVQDTLHPDRVVIGCDDQFGREQLKRLHEPLNAPIIAVSPESAQMGKYASNAYLATRITFINQIADICEHNGANVQEVIEVMGHDKRIGSHYWYPGLGYGGSCFPKDVRELAAYSRQVGLDNNLFNELDRLNTDRIPTKLVELSKAVGDWKGKRVAVLGLAFKPHTDDMREAPSLYVVPELLKHGAEVLAYDPMATEMAQKIWADKSGLSFMPDVSSALKDVDAVLVLIEWPEIIEYPFVDEAGDGRLFFDARNQFDPEQLRSTGWQYVGVGQR